MLEILFEIPIQEWEVTYNLPTFRADQVVIETKQEKSIQAYLYYYVLINKQSSILHYNKLIEVNRECQQ